MNNKLTRKWSVFILSVIGSLERFSFYGMRMLLIFYLFESGSIDFSSDSSMLVISLFALFIAVLPLPMGLLTDFIFKQERSVVIGSVISLIGYLALFIPNIYVIGFGLFLIAIGSSLVRPNTLILVGRLFDKRDGKRDLAFIFLMAGINFCTLISIFIVGYVGKKIGFNYGFGITALATLIYLILFLMFKNKIRYKEKDISELEEEIEDVDIMILDSELISKKSKPNFLIVLIFIFLLSIVYKEFYSAVSMSQLDSLLSFDNLILFGQEIRERNLYSFLSYFFIPGIFLTFIFLHIQKNGSTISRFGYGMIILGVASIFVYFTIDITKSQVMIYSMLPLILIAISEAIISVLGLSYLTRISKVKYSSTIYGGFLLFTYLIPKIINLFGFSIEEREYIIYTVLMFIIGILILLIRKHLIKYANGID
jgi:POT family proton-dependent oligopeptide transporter